MFEENEITSPNRTLSRLNRLPYDANQTLTSQLLGLCILSRFVFSSEVFNFWCSAAQTQTINHLSDNMSTQSVSVFLCCGSVLRWLSLLVSPCASFCDVSILSPAWTCLLTHLHLTYANTWERHRQTPHLSTS